MQGNESHFGAEEIECLVSRLMHVAESNYVSLALSIVRMSNDFRTSDRMLHPSLSYALCQT